MCAINLARGEVSTPLPSNAFCTSSTRNGRKRNTSHLEKCFGEHNDAKQHRLLSYRVHDVQRHVTDIKVADAFIYNDIKYS